eukprot:SAG11_NODE_17612_length_513_cov_1.480676_1_plen_39_part_10
MSTSSGIADICVVMDGLTDWVAPDQLENRIQGGTEALSP